MSKLVDKAANIAMFDQVVHFAHRSSVDKAASLANGDLAVTFARRFSGQRFGGLRGCCGGSARSPFADRNTLLCVRGPK